MWCAYLCTDSLTAYDRSWKGWWWDIHDEYSWQLFSEWALKHPSWGRSFEVCRQGARHNVPLPYGSFLVLLSKRDFSHGKLRSLSHGKANCDRVALPALHVVHAGLFSSKIHKRLKRTLFNWTRKNAQIFQGGLLFQSYTYHTKMNKQSIYLSFASWMLGC